LSQTYYEAVGIAAHRVYTRYYKAVRELNRANDRKEYDPLPEKEYKKIADEYVQAWRALFTEMKGVVNENIVQCGSDPTNGAHRMSRMRPER
jgi:hypothetical protein